MSKPMRVAARRVVAVRAHDVKFLTPRMVQILHLAAQGFMAKEIAKQFGSSPRTVEMQRSDLLRIMRVPNMCNAVAVAIATGIIQFEASDEAKQCLADLGFNPQEFMHKKGKH